MVYKPQYYPGSSSVAKNRRKHMSDDVEKLRDISDEDLTALLGHRAPGSDYPSTHPPLAEIGEPACSVREVVEPTPGAAAGDRIRYAQFSDSMYNGPAVPYWRSYHAAINFRGVDPGTLSGRQVNEMRERDLEEYTRRQAGTEITDWGLAGLRGCTVHGHSLRLQEDGVMFDMLDRRRLEGGVIVSDKDQVGVPIDRKVNLGKPMSEAEAAKRTTIYRVDNVSFRSDKEVIEHVQKVWELRTKYGFYPGNEFDLWKYKVTWNEKTHIPRLIYGFTIGPYEGTPEEIAGKFLERNLDSLKISAGFRDLKLEKIIKCLGTSTVMFQQHYKNIPIHGAWIAIHIDKDNRIYSIRNDTVPMPLSKRNKKILKEEEASSLSEIDSIIEKKIAACGKLTKKYLFSWNEILRDDEKKLTSFLKKNLGIDWIKKVEKKEFDNKRTIQFINKKNNLILKFIDEKTRSNLKVDNLKIDNLRTYEFFVRNENIYTGIEKENMLYFLNDNLRRVWKIKFSTTKPVGAWILFLDKTKGYTIEERNIINWCEGKGLVFDPNPIASSNMDDFSFDNVPDGAYYDRPLTDLESEDSLVGKYVTTPKPIRDKDRNFLFKRDNRKKFDQVMAYYHITEAQKKIKEEGILDEDNLATLYPIEVIIKNDPTLAQRGGCYDPRSRTITFYAGDNVDGAEDGDIILHEFGHAIIQAMIGDFGKNDEEESLGEGFADYFAGDYFAPKKEGERKYRLAEWYMKEYGLEQGALRSLNCNGDYYSDPTSDIYKKAEIISSCLFKIREYLEGKDGPSGVQKANEVILKSIMEKPHSFQEFANYIMEYVKIIDKKEKEIIRGFFKRYGITPVEK
jgi:methyl-coenzyme M reductase gamma subunit